MGIGGHLQDPTLTIPLITDTLSGLFELGDMIRMRNNPNTRRLQNINIGAANNMLNEARSGQGVSTPFSNMSEYTRRQIGNSGNVHNPFAESIGTIGSGKPGQFKLPDTSAGFGDTSMYNNPYRTTIERGANSPGVENLSPAGPGFLERAGEFLGNLLPKFEVGVTSVPQTMPAVVHEGEMIVPKEMNPLAGSPPQAMRGNIPMMRNNAGIPPAPPPVPMQQPPAAPPQGQMVNNVSLAPNMNLPQGGLNPQMQQMLAQRNNEQVNQQMQTNQRLMREQAATNGNIGGGDLQSQMLMSRLAADSAKNNFSRDLAISAEDRRFADEMAKANFGLQQQGTLGGLDLQRRELDLNRQLGEGDLALRNRGQNQQYDLGQQELGLGRDRLGLDRDTANREFGLAQQRQQLEDYLGRGQLGLQGRAQTLDEQLGRGNLDLQNRQFGLDSRLGLGQLGIQQQQANLQGELGRGQLSLDRLLGTRNANVQQQLADQNFNLANRQMNFEQGTQFREGQRQFDQDAEIRRLIANGQISLGNRGLDLQQQGQQTDTEFGQFDRNYRSYWDSLNRQDALAGLNTQANQGSEDFMQQFFQRLFGQGAIPQAAGA